MASQNHSFDDIISEQGRIYSFMNFYAMFPNIKYVFHYSEMVMISYAVILNRTHILFDIDVEKVWVPSNYLIE